MSLTNGLKAYYKLDGTANDAHGTNHGSLNSLPFFTDNTTFTGDALNFDGVDDYISVPHNATLNGLKSISFWMKPTYDWTQGADKTEYFCGKRRGDQNKDGWIFYMQRTNGAVVLKLHNDPGNGAGGNTWSEAATFVVGQWYHIVYTDKKIYIDGIDKTTIGSNPYGWNTLVDTGMTLGIGHVGEFAYHGNDYFFSGAMDDFALWDRALTASEPQEIYNNGIDNCNPLLETGANCASATPGSGIRFTVIT